MSLQGKNCDSSLNMSPRGTETVFKMLHNACCVFDEITLEEDHPSLNNAIAENRKHKESPRSLFDLSCFTIRKNLSIKILKSVKSLGLPEQIEKLVSFEKFAHDEIIGDYDEEDEEEEDG